MRRCLGILSGLKHGCPEAEVGNPHTSQKVRRSNLVFKDRRFVLLFCQLLLLFLPPLLLCSSLNRGISRNKTDDVSLSKSRFGERSSLRNNFPSRGRLGIDIYTFSIAALFFDVFLIDRTFPLGGKPLFLVNLSNSGFGGLHVHKKLGSVVRGFRAGRRTNAVK